MQSVSLRLALSIVAGAATLGIGLPLRAAGLHTVTETLTDRCSVQVQIKNPYANSSNSIDPSDVLLDRDGNLGTVGSAMEGGHYEKIGPNGFSNWSAVITPVPANSDRYFRWYCGPTAERSRCPSDTKGIKARIGPGRLFETQCLK
jgi:hypothetical protein